MGDVVLQKEDKISCLPIVLHHVDDIQLVHTCRQTKGWELSLQGQMCHLYCVISSFLHSL